MLLHLCNYKVNTTKSSCRDDLYSSEEYLKPNFKTTKSNLYFFAHFARDSQSNAEKRAEATS